MGWLITVQTCKPVHIYNNNNINTGVLSHHCHVIIIRYSIDIDLHGILLSELVTRGHLCSATHLL